MLSYLILDRILEDDNDFSSLVQKMFVVIEMDGFGYPMIDLFRWGLFGSFKGAYDAQEQMMTAENIDKKFNEKINNAEEMTRLELENLLKRKKWIWEKIILRF